MGVVGRYGTALLVGLVLAVVASFDFLIGRVVGLRWVPILDVSPGLRVESIWVEVPYLVSGLVLLLSASVCLLVRNFYWLWDRRIKILLVLLILTPQVSSLAIGSLELSDLIVPVFLYVLCLDLFMGEKLTVSPVVLLILPLIAFMALSCINLGFRPLIAFVREVKFLPIPFIVVLSIRNYELLRFAVKAFIVTLVFSALIGLVQEAVFLLTGIAMVGVLSEAFREVFLFEETSFGTMMRAQGFFGVPALYGTGMAAGGATVLYLLLAQELRLFKRRSLLYPTLSVLVAALFLSFNRPAAAAFFVAALLALYLARPSLFIHITASLSLVVLAGIIAGIASPRLIEKLIEEVRIEARYFDLRERIVLNRRSLIGVTTRHPIIGAGMGVGARYNLHHRRWAAHSSPLAAAADIGILGAMIFVAIFVLAMARLFGVLVDVRREAEHRALAKALLAGFMAVFLHMLVEPFWHKFSFGWFYVGLIEGLNILALRETRSVTAEELWKG